MGYGSRFPQKECSLGSRTPEDLEADQVLQSCCPKADFLLPPERPEGSQALANPGPDAYAT